jgi:hypothetical protein
MMAARIRTTPMVILHSFRLSNQRYYHMPTAFGLTTLAVQALPAEKFVRIGVI